MKNTYTQAADFWQERDFGAKISATFEFIGVHWRPLGRVLLYLVVPVALLQGIVAALMQTELAGAMRQPAGGAFSNSFALYSHLLQSPLYVLSTVMGVALHTVLILSVYGYLLRCLHPVVAGQPITPADVWTVVKRKFIGTFFSLYGVWIIIGLSFLVLFVPGVYMGVVLSLFFAVSVLEDSGFGTTLNRCVSLTRGHWWATFGLLLLFIFLIYLVFASLGIIALVFGGLKALALHSGTLPTPILVAISSVSSILSLLLYPPIMLALAFQYFHLVEVKDGHGLRMLVDKLGQRNAVAEAQSSHYRPDEEGEY